MAVALAILPLKSLLTGDGEWWLAAAAGCEWTTGFAGALCTGPTGLATFLVTAFGAGFATGFFATLVFGVAFLTAALPGAGFPTTFFAAAAFFGGAFLAGIFFAATFFAGAFFAATFCAGAAFFAGALAAGFPAAGLDAAFFVVLAAGRAAGFAEDLTGDFLAIFTIRSLLAAAFDLPAPAAALADVFPLCALTAVELALVFAISLHRGWP